MKPIRQFLDKIRPAFEEGGKLERLYPLFEATDTFLYTTDDVTTVEPHVRDSMDLKRIMMLVVYAMTPCILMAMWNTGYQANTAMQAMNMAAAPAIRIINEMTAAKIGRSMKKWENIGCVYRLTCRPRWAYQRGQRYHSGQPLRSCCPSPV